MKDHARSGQEQVVALLLGVFVLLAALLFVSVRSKAEDEGGISTAEISTAAPTSVTLTGFTGVTSTIDIKTAGLTPEEGYMSNTTLELTFVDPNGCSQVTTDEGVQLKIAMYETINDPTGSSCRATGATDYQTCLFWNSFLTDYTTSVGNTCDGPTDTSVSYIFSGLELPHMLQDSEGAGIWQVSTTLIDSEGAELSGLTTEGQFEVASTNFMQVIGSNTVAFGTVGLGASTTAATPLKIRNASNEMLDFMIEVSDMGCTGGGHIQSYDAGELGVGLRAGLTDVAFPSLNEMTLAGTTLTTGTKLTSALDANLNREGVDWITNSGLNSSTDFIYWGIGIPATGVSGSCSGSIILSSVVN